MLKLSALPAKQKAYWCSYMGSKSENGGQGMQAMQQAVLPSPGSLSRGCGAVLSDLTVCKLVCFDIKPSSCLHKNFLMPSFVNVENRECELIATV